MSDLNIVHGVYDPNEKDPGKRWIWLARELEANGLAQNEWFLNRMRQLALPRRGDKKLESEIYEAIGKREQLAVVENLNRIFPKPSIPQIDDGILLGNVVDAVGDRMTPTDEPVHLPFESFLQHGSIFSKTGGGKTRLLSQIAVSCAPHCGEFIFEVRKHDLRGLHSLFLKHGFNLGVLSWRDHTLRMNPLEVPPNAHPQTWITELAEMFASATDLPEVAERLLQCAIHKQYEENGVLTGGDHYGDVFELMKRAEGMKEFPRVSRDALANRLDLLIQKLGPKSLAYEKAYPIQQMESGHWLFALDGLPTPVSAFISNYFIAYVLRRRLECPAKGKPLLFFLEEARDLLTKPNPEFQKNIEIVRSSGISLHFNTQVSKLNEGIRNSCSLKIMGNLDEPEIRDLAPSFRIEPHQKHWWIDHQQRRLFLLKCDLLSYRKAFPFWSAPIDLPADVDPVAFTATQGLTVGKLAEHLVPSRADSAKMIHSAVEKPVTLNTDAPGNDLVQITSEHIAYLNAIVTRPDQSSTRYDELVEIDGKTGVGRAKGTRLREGLIEAELVRLTKIYTGGWKDYTILRPTSKAWTYLQPEVKDRYLATYPDPEKLRPGAAHDHKMRRVRETFTTLGYRVQSERPIELAQGGMFQVDLSLESPDSARRIGVEIQETDLGKIRDKALLLQAAECLTEGYIIVPSRKSLASPANANGGKVRIETLATFLDTIRP